MFNPNITLSQAQAGLLTFSVPGRLPTSEKTGSGQNAREHMMEITAAGTVQDSHLVPFYPGAGAVPGYLSRYKEREIFARKENFFCDGHGIPL